MPVPFAVGDHVVWWRCGRPYPSTVVGFTAKRVRIQVDDTANDLSGALRIVDAAFLRHVGMHWIRAFHKLNHSSIPKSSWGTLTRYLEVGEDHRATRHIDVWENGRILSYDRDHWIDEFGMLADGISDPTLKLPDWIEVCTIPRKQFETVWRQARSSSDWIEQQSNAQMAVVGFSPIWLRPAPNRL